MPSQIKNNNPTYTILRDIILDSHIWQKNNKSHPRWRYTTLHTQSYSLDLYQTLTLDVRSLLRMDSSFHRHVSIHFRYHTVILLQHGLCTLTISDWFNLFFPPHSLCCSVQTLHHSTLSLPSWTHQLSLLVRREHLQPDSTLHQTPLPPSTHARCKGQHVSPSKGLLTFPFPQQHIPPLWQG
jgi:hypothetical protein